MLCAVAGGGASALSPMVGWGMMGKEGWWWVRFSWLLLNGSQQKRGKIGKRLGQNDCV